METMSTKKSNAIRNLIEKLGYKDKEVSTFWENMSPEEVNTVLDVMTDTDLSTEEMLIKMNSIIEEMA